MARTLFPLLALAGWLVAAALPGVVAREIGAPDVSPRRPAAKVRQLRERANRLVLEKAAAEARSEQARAATRRCEAEIERYKSGLARAVGELNRRSREPVRLGNRAASARHTPPPQRRRGPRVLDVTPTIQVLGSRIRVHGRVVNRESEPILGRLEIELLHDGRRHDSASRPLEIHPGGSASFEQTFSTIGIGSGTFEARAVLRY